MATEFDIQGLEIDWACLAWDIDYYWKDGRWNHQKFKGTKWQKINSEIERPFLKNAYRVLLTRARQGLIIYIPVGDSDDATTPPALYENNYEFFKSCGFFEI